MKNQMKVKLKNVFNFLSHSAFGSIMLFISIIAIDQLSKQLILQYRILPIYLNYNVAFSLPIPWYLPWLLIVGMLVFYFLYSKQRATNFAKFKQFFSSHSFESVAVILMAGGGCSNVIDRFFHNGAVVDFIDLKWWPVFNFADSFIVSGLLLYLYASMKSSSRPHL